MPKTVRFKQKNRNFSVDYFNRLLESREMDLQPRLELLPAKKLAGKCMKMSYAENKTPVLWRSFMTERKLITNNLNQDLFSLQVYPEHFGFQNFNPELTFEKWALTEVSDFDNLPETMQPFLLPAGLYAVFHFRGTPETAPQTFNYIFNNWLPASAYALDQRPHFELLGTNYQNNSPDSEEEIWIPVKAKS